MMIVWQAAVGAGTAAMVFATYAFFYKAVFFAAAAILMLFAMFTLANVIEVFKRGAAR